MGHIKLSSKTFITLANQKHNSFYNYEKSIYKNCKEKLIIECPLHGEFLQDAAHHVFHGNGCPKCKIIKVTSKTTKTLDNFIERSNIKHNNFYTYNNSIYINCKIKLLVTCPLHGDFSVTPDNHIRGRGCRSCGTERSKIASMKDINYFIEKSKIIHDNFYCYDKVIKKRPHDKVTIICPLHGDFGQSFPNHLAGKGCPKCNTVSKSEKIIMRLLDLNNIDYKYQKTFTDCINPRTNRKLSYDFYILDKNILIEYDGQHHFMEVSRYKNSLEYQKYKDCIKDLYCKQNNITLLRISYKDKISEILLKNNIITHTINELNSF